jgi:uncharacterized protein involved in cysteine biosynthesis
MLGDLALALDELRHRAFWGVAAGSVTLTLLLFAAVFGLAGWALGVGGDLTANLPLIGEATAPGAVGVVLYVLAAIAASLILMGPVAALFVGVFLEVVVASVERRRYPSAPPGKAAPLFDQLRAALGLFGAVLLGNLVVLGLSFLVPPLAPLLLIGVNGWLLGREYVDTVALRRMDRKAATAFRRAHSLRIFGVGVAMAALMAVPLANLLAPLLGAAAATHLVHRAGGAR